MFGRGKSKEQQQSWVSSSVDLKIDQARKLLDSAEELASKGNFVSAASQRDLAFKSVQGASLDDSSEVLYDIASSWQDEAEELHPYPPDEDAVPHGHDERDYTAMCYQKAAEVFLYSGDTDSAEELFGEAAEISLQRIESGNQFMYKPEDIAKLEEVVVNFRRANNEEMADLVSRKILTQKTLESLRDKQQ